ncbi:MAG: CopG family antitoxin [Candidatus Daviesbacteria bacterium]|nr:CopG family antitoxin [Candidatus Daviesbacteria bacterium]
MKKRKKFKSKIPNFKTYEEEANFWDTHDITSFEDETEEVEIIFALEKPKEETLVLRLQEDTKKKLIKIAKSKGISVSSLARLWLTEKAYSSNI